MTNWEGALREKIAKGIYGDWGVGKWDKLTASEKEPWLKTAAPIAEEISKLKKHIATRGGQIAVLKQQLAETKP